MSDWKRIQGLLEQLTDFVERTQKAIPVLADKQPDWRRGYVPQGGGSGGGTADLTAPERIASSPQPDRDIAEWAWDLERWAQRALQPADKGGLDLDRRRGRLLPLPPSAARELVEASEPGCRIHAQVGSHRKVHVQKERLCRQCYDFKAEQAGGIDNAKSTDEPPLWIVQMWVDGKRVYDRDIKEWRAQQRVEAEERERERSQPLKRDRRKKRRNWRSAPADQHR